MKKCEDANSMVDLSWNCLLATVQNNIVLRSTGSWRRSRGLFEHPEHFGTAPKGEPTSVWEMQVSRDVAMAGIKRMATYQCHLHEGLPYSKGTGLQSDILLLELQPGISEGFPSFASGWLNLPGGRSSWSARLYQGPLPQSCGHAHASLGKEEGRS